MEEVDAALRNSASAFKEYKKLGIRQRAVFLRTIARKLGDQQEKLLILLEEAKQVNLNSIRIPISIAKFIKLKLGDVFMFLIAHNIRHVKQAERIIAAAVKNVEVNNNGISFAVA